MKTDLSRHYTAKSAMFAVLVPVFTGMFGKSPENGARTYMAAVTTKEEDHGRIVQFYKSEKELRT